MSLRKEHAKRLLKLVKVGKRHATKIYRKLSVSSWILRNPREKTLRWQRCCKNPLSKNSTQNYLEILLRTVVFTTNPGVQYCLDLANYSLLIFITCIVIHEAILYFNEIIQTIQTKRILKRVWKKKSQIYFLKGKFTRFE